ncbi:DeoR family transcriptional regulator [Marinitenerispora sediminis]|uniref:DeoR family transcriptional regulator n=1 Tax=Marinitenerispora sediminis TaxID=1931232 RepID=A0A368TBQ4_9ACTN|nr:DeoR family transcriptional regulator [Marinitenerispora sediminis]RCV61469.1 DeoR family transcriptional regulator [Marinitenerispora sediminis]RCV62548.1 DeoR family transcriptional regulator [Marinitenerispora sediminis]
MRHQRLLDAVTDGIQRVEDLAEALDVSPSTVRRGLTDLERAGKVVRTHGGAVPVPATGELSWTQKSRRNSAAKRRIAEYAADLVQEGDVVLLDAGSTTTFVAERLAERTGITVVTNGLGPLWALREAEGVDVLLTGGRLRQRRGSIVGEHTRGVLDRITADVAFLGADGLVPERGVNCPSPELAAVKELMLNRARRAVIVADSTKIGADPYPNWALIPGEHTVVTDAGIPEDARLRLAADPRCTPVVVAAGQAPSSPAPLPD